MKRFAGLAAFVALGAFLRWATFPPLDFSALVFIALVPMLIVARALPPMRAAAATFCGTGLFVILAIAWMWRLGDNYLSHAFACGIWAFVVVGVSLFEAVFAYVVSRLRGHVRIGFPIVIALFAEAALWSAIESLRGTLLLGCGWNGLAAAVTDLPFWIAPARYVGAAGAGACVFLVNAALAETVAAVFRISGASVRRTCTAAGCALAGALAACAFAWWGFRADVDTPGTRCRVVLDQPGVSKSDRDACAKRLAAFADSKPDLALLSESAFSGCGPGDEPDARAAATRLLQASGAEALVTGASLRPAGRREATVAVLYRPDTGASNGTARVAGVYWKRRLVPIGEYAPFAEYFPVIRRFIPADEIPGERHQRLFRTNDGAGPAFGVLICFEGSFPELARELAIDGAQGILHLVNDAWFVKDERGALAGLRRAEMLQHARQTALRAVETGLPIVRASEWGMTGVFSPDGGVKWLATPGSTEPLCFAPGAMSVEIALPLPVSTPYVRFGDTPVYVCAVLSFLLAFVRRSVV